MSAFKTSLAPTGSETHECRAGLDGLEMDDAGHCGEYITHSGVLFPSLPEAAADTEGS